MLIECDISKDTAKETMHKISASVNENSSHQVTEQSHISFPIKRFMVKCDFAQN